ncbi:hypothetical protein SARC_08121 [Sphaeroforma arctica JP610]|uniref:Sugar phosphate transporter domain-containing protein n=1 Tax=Sphaeroforma arctica JP610 TaxID=667725 RepID=A0A0L0FU84_9EUKA|nr:hypothetical protein SARC_08121 [Sphaeroforma arctica JP610]KNC79488.1 hypothetical protein SARC_08121 [Sphaeroforma arctica JP610]|eukprot:XP_014153390.1 hypothetical protein SARC_08121 [Sphaeroforma arctica JP610]
MSAPKPLPANKGARAIASVVSYSLCSMTMIYTNKLCLSSYHFGQYVNLLLSAQCSIAAVLLYVMKLQGYIRLNPFDVEVAKKWFPATVLFCVMLYTGSQSLNYLTIPLVTVFKNLTNILIAYGDKHFYHQHVSTGVVLALILMLTGSILSAWTDISFNLTGYIWMALNCIGTAGYTLYIRQAKQNTNLDQWGMSFYNNVLTCCLTIPAAFLNGEVTGVQEFEYLYDPQFLLALFVSGAIGTGLSLSVFWCINETSPTTYSMVGSLNKIPLTILSFLVFAQPLTFASGVSIGFGIFSGIVFTYAKYKQSEADRVLKENQLKEGGP